MEGEPRAELRPGPAGQGPCQPGPVPQYPSRTGPEMVVRCNQESGS